MIKRRAFGFFYFSKNPFLIKGGRGGYRLRLNDVLFAFVFFAKSFLNKGREGRFNKEREGTLLFAIK